MKLDISSKAYLVLLLFLSVLIVWPVFLPGYFSHHDDLQVMRIFEMRKCIEDLQIPCRWVPDMGYGNGFPLFNYYSALPYYIGGVLSFFLGLINSAKALFLIPLVLGGIFMFILGQKLFGKDVGFLVAVLYLFAPYRALDSFVRGAIAESFAIAVIPLVFYFILKISEKPSGMNIALGSVSIGAFLISHNIMTMLFMPFVIFWGLINLHFRKWENWRPLLISFILGVCLSSFFLLPVFLEKDLVQTETLIQGGGNFRTHFVTVGQLFLDRSWGHGGSEFGPKDTISFQIGWPLWWFTLILVPVLILNFKKQFKTVIFCFFFLGMFLISIFMTHNKSTFIWEMIEALAYAQFPWRFLSLTIFSASIIAGYCFYFLKGFLKYILIYLTVILTVLLNWNYFVPRDFYPWINDQNKLEDPLWEIQQKAGILDYLPKSAYEPFGRAPDKPEIIKGQAVTSNYKVRSSKFSFNVNVLSHSTIEVPVFDFPNWTVYIDGQKVNHTKAHLGRISIDLNQGNYLIEGRFKDTWVRTIGNALTLVSLLIIILISKDKLVKGIY